MINIISIPYTGTHFIKNLLESAGLKVRARHVEAWEPTPDLIIAPIRNPLDVYISWISNERDQDFFKKWKDFNKMFEEQNLFILPIDTEDRDCYLAELSSVLGVKLKTDWKPINQKVRRGVETVDLSEVYSLPVVRKFYNTNITRDEAEKIVRQVMQSHAGEKLAPNLFKESVDELMREANA
jgi:hypothetical protein